MDPTALDPRLADLVGRVMTDLALHGMPAPPPSAPAPGQTHEDWVATVATVRTQHDELAQVLTKHMRMAAPEVGSVVDHEIPVDGGTIAARVYTPPGAGPHPAVVFFHGGAFWLGGGEIGFGLTDDYCRVFCDRLSAVVVNVDYRLAPEAPFPKQLHDSYAGLAWTVEHADELGVDTDRVAVMGASSGGNQAAAVCLLARDRGGPRITAQILHVPVLDLTWGSESVRADPGFAAFDDLVRLYATDEQRREPLVSPLLATDLAGLPPAVIVTGAFDGLRDDGRRFAERLAEQGVPVTHTVYPMLHNIALPETTMQFVDDVVGAVTPLLAPNAV
ncbi:MAG: alpha/beta hydrolase [Jatrophihabitans sp.]|uniref:alpha/beta hydrolase n=1 Tax=Jatrophihabitans sp. TaxID=1932789 RepID=UPI003F7FF60D